MMKYKCSLLGAVVCFALVINTNILVAAVIISENFDSYSLGSWPSLWIRDANAISDPTNNRIVQDPENQSNQVLKIYGNVGGCWSALDYLPVNFRDDFYLEFRVYNGSEPLSGCHPGRAAIGMKYGSHWSNPGFTYMQFHEHSTVGRDWTDVLSDYLQNHWHNIKIHYQRSGNSITLTYWMDEEYLGTRYDYVDLDIHLTMNHLHFTSQEGTVYIDDVVVYTEDQDLEEAKQRIVACTNAPDWDAVSYVVRCGTDISLSFANGNLLNPLSLADAFCDAVNDGDWCGLFAEGVLTVADSYASAHSFVGIVPILECATEAAGLDTDKVICDAAVDALLRHTFVIPDLARYIFSVMTLSPVDISVKDMEGNRLWIDEDGVVHKTLSENGGIITLDGHREILIIPDSQENYLVEIIGRSEAQQGDSFSLKIFHAINNDDQIFVTYENVPVLSTTVASVLIGSNMTSYGLDIDSNGDEVPESTVLPTTLNGQVFDNDGDGYGFDTDCDESDPNINPESYELPGNYVDENCDNSLGVCDPSSTWKNHGQFVQCVSREIKTLLRQGVLSGKEGAALISNAAQSDIGKKIK